MATMATMAIPMTRTMATMDIMLRMQRRSVGVVVGVFGKERGRGVLNKTRRRFVFEQYEKGGRVVEGRSCCGGRS